MREWPFRIAFAALFVGSLASKERAADVLVKPTDFEPAIIRVARSHGLTFREDGRLAGTDVHALSFEAPGCSQPVLVVPLAAILDEESILPVIGEPDGVLLRYVYIGRSWQKPDRLELFLERMKYAALKTLRLTRYVPDPHLLLIVSSSECPTAGRIDWRNAWNRDYLAAIRTSTEATSK